ncbi:MAG: DMT family transporter [Phycisphaerales bacterium]
MPEPSAHAPAFHHRHPHLFGVACVLFTLVGWSSVPLFLKHFSHDIDAWTSNGWRYGFSALVWAPLLIVHRLRGSLPLGLWKAALVPAAFNILGQVCFTHGFYYISPGLFTFGLRTQIVFVTLGAVLLFPSERKVILSPLFVVGAVMVLIGAAGVVLQGTDVFAGATAFGALLAVASGFLFASYALAVRKFMAGMPSMLAFAAISQYTAAAMLALMFPLGERAGAGAWDMPWDQFGLLLFSALIGIAIGHVAYYMAIARLGVAVSSGVIQLQPFLVAACSYWLFAEVLSAGQWAAGLVAVFGAGLILWRQGAASRQNSKAANQQSSK